MLMIPNSISLFHLSGYHSLGPYFLAAGGDWIWFDQLTLNSGDGGWKIS